MKLYSDNLTACARVMAREAVSRWLMENYCIECGGPYEAHRVSCRLYGARLGTEEEFKALMAPKAA